MKNLAKKIVVGLMAGSLFFVGAGEVYAAENNRPPKPPTQEQMQARLGAWAKATSKWSSVSEKDLLNAVQKKEKSFEDIEIAAMLSKISKKSFNDVLAMKTDWSDVMKKLGVTREKYDAAFEELTIQSLADDAEISEDLIKTLLSQHYYPRDIVIAGKLAKASGKNIQDVLDMKKINQRWVDVARELKVSKNVSDETQRRENEENEEQAPPPPPQE